MSPVDDLPSAVAWSLSGQALQQYLSSVASFPGHVGGEKVDLVSTLLVHAHSQKNLGIRVHLQMVDKIDTRTSDSPLFIQR